MGSRDARYLHIRVRRSGASVRPLQVARRSAAAVGPVRDRQGAVRGALRAQQSPRLGLDPDPQPPVIHSLMDEQAMPPPADTRPITAVWPGEPYPRGATWDGEGVNFALFAGNAHKVELCIFDASGRHEVQRIELRERTDEIWHSYLPEARPGTLYGYRVHGPYDPA